MIEKRNLQLIYDRDHGTENEGWYTRHDEYQDGELLNASVDETLGEDADYPRADALADACLRFGVEAEEIEVHD